MPARGTEDSASTDKLRFDLQREERPISGALCISQCADEDGCGNQEAQRSVAHRECDEAGDPLLLFVVLRRPFVGNPFSRRGALHRRMEEADEIFFCVGPSGIGPGDDAGRAPTLVVVAPSHGINVAGGHVQENVSPCPARQRPQAPPRINGIPMFAVAGTTCVRQQFQSGGQRLSRIQHHKIDFVVAFFSHNSPPRENSGNGVPQRPGHEEPNAEGDCRKEERNHGCVRNGHHRSAEDDDAHHGAGEDFVLLFSPIPGFGHRDFGRLLPLRLGKRIAQFAFRKGAAPVRAGVQGGRSVPGNPLRLAAVFVPVRFGINVK